MNKKQLLLLPLIILFYNVLFGQSYKLPQQFLYAVPQATQNYLPKNIDSKKTHFFLVFVPEHFNEKQALSFFKETTIPKDFFQKGIPNNTTTRPEIIIFNWQDEELNTRNRLVSAGLFTTGIKQLQNDFPQSYFIIIGHGQGGNLAYHATQSLQKPFNTLIQLFVPHFPKTYSEYQPNHTMILQWYTLYNDHLFISKHPANTPPYLPFLTHNDQSTNTKCFLNRSQLHSRQILEKPFIGRYLLATCKKTKQISPTGRFFTTTFHTHAPTPFTVQLDPLSLHTKRIDQVKSKLSRPPHSQKPLTPSQRRKALLRALSENKTI